MKQTLVAFAALMLLLLQSPTLGQTVAVPAFMNFQGRLAKPDGTPVANGNYNLQFSLYNALTSGTLWWQRSIFNVPVRNGTFAAGLDFSSGFQNSATLDSLFGASAIYLEISINGAAPLTPRQQFVTVAYAMKANRVKDSSITSASILDGTITNADLASNAVTSAKILDGTITGADIANGTITAEKLAANSFMPLVWLLNGNSGVTSGFLGTTDNNPLEFRVNNRRAMRYQYAENTATAGFEYHSVNVLGGSALNETGQGVVGATVSGGGADYFNFTDYPNRVMADFGTVGGGTGNTASGYAAAIAGGVNNIASGNTAAIGGGFNNIASGFAATIAGGDNNTASGHYAAIAGGNYNTASGPASFAAGFRAKANHHGTFVWADSTVGDFASTGDSQFLIRAHGGVGINTNDPAGYALHVNGDVSIVYRLTLGNTFEQTSVGEFNIDAPNVVGGRVRVLTNGNVGLGIPNPGVRLDVNGTVRCTNLTEISDARYKRHVTTLDNALEAILNLRGVTFDWKRDDYPDMNFTQGRQVGFIAQEVEKVLPELVTTDQNGYKSVAYADIVPVLVEAVKTQQKQMEAFKRDNDTLRGENAAIREQMSELLRAVQELKADLKAMRK